MALMIIFDVTDDGARETLVDAIALLGEYIKLAETTYAVNTTQTPAQVHATLNPHLASEDQLLVLPISKPYTGGNARVQEWLDENV